MTRRTALRTAAGAGTVLAASRGLPAWARPIAAATAVKGPGSRPFPGRPEGAVSMPQIEHIVVVMMENHSFDNVLGMLPHRVRSRRRVDGLPVDRHGHVTASQRDAAGHAIRATRFDTPCQLPSLPNQDWNDSHIAFNGGRMDGFVRASGPIAMRFYDQGDLPFTYGLAARFPIGERYFQSCLAQTYPNRRFLFAGTASGTIATVTSELGKYPPPNGTIFDRLDQHSIPWKVYYENLPSPDIIPGFDDPALNRNPKILKIDQFYADAAAGRLPAFTFLDPDYDTTSEENPQDIQVGEQFVHDVVTAVMHAPTWSKTALFLTYDEHGGYYDHVPPPRAIKPDSTEPRLAPGDVPGSYDRYGFRVPLIVVSPWARANYASRVVQDHTSILRFVERKWNLGAMTFRDANAADLTDYFDFRRAAFAHPPALPAAPPLAPGLVHCRAHGLFPKLPPGVTE